MVFLVGASDAGLGWCDTSFLRRSPVHGEGHVARQAMKPVELHSRPSDVQVF